MSRGHRALRALDVSLPQHTWFRWMVFMLEQRNIENMQGRATPRYSIVHSLEIAILGPKGHS